MITNIGCCFFVFYTFLTLPFSPVQLSSLSTERDALTSEVSQTSAARSELQETLEETNRSHQEQVNDLLQQLDSKSRAGEAQPSH